MGSLLAERPVLVRSPELERCIGRWRPAMRWRAAIRPPRSVVLTLCLAASFAQLFAWIGPVAAHDFTITDVVLVVKADGSFYADVTADLDALALGVSAFAEVSDSGVTVLSHDADESIQALAASIAAAEAEERTALERRLRRMFLTRVRVRIDGEPLRHAVVFPDRSPVASSDEPDVTEAQGEGLLGEHPPVESTATSYFGVTARLTGSVPAGSSELTLAASRSFRAVHLTVLQQLAESVERQVLGPGEESRPIHLLYREAPQRVPVAEASGGKGWSTVLDYVHLGFIHIVPRGLDHIAFVLGLCLLMVDWRSLVVWVSAFTVGHTVSLGLAMFGLLQAAPALIEPLIALSIGWVGWRAIQQNRSSGDHALDSAEPDPDWRSGALIVVGLGLLHGSGFAGVLTELGLPPNAWLAGLVGFNLGVELGQILVLVAGLVSLWLLSKVMRRKWVVTTAGALLLVLSLAWTLQRVAGW